MAVYTRIERKDLEHLLAHYAIGELEDFQPIAAGITNTNYFVDTGLGRWVLTLFEDMTADELPFFMTVMDHLAGHGLPVAHPVARNDGAFLSAVRARPAALVHCLDGASVAQPCTAQCRSLGTVVAAMHHAVQTLHVRQRNSRDLAWIDSAARRLDERLDAATRTLLHEEIEHQRQLARSPDWQQLPQAVVHADMFRDNVLFGADRVTGVIDFYYACHEYLLFDLAVICNDWCFDDATNFRPEHWQAFMHAYAQQHPLDDRAQRAWPGMLRAAALRFWASRLYDYHFPSDGEMIHVHDPQLYEQLLRHHRSNPPPLT